MSLTDLKQSLWSRAEITIALKNRIVGGIPTNANLIEGWIAANMTELSEEKRAELAQKTKEELPAAVEETASKMWTTFKRDETGLYIEGRQVKALFKESANILRELLIKSEKKGAKGKEAGNGSKSRFTNFKAKLAERLFVEEEKIYFLRDDQPVTEPDGSEERGIHVMTAQGPRTALKRVDYVAAPATITFHVRWLPDGVIDREIIELLLEHGSMNGLGADRSQGSGLFTVEAVRELQLRR
jgi:hypothetical protein